MKKFALIGFAIAMSGCARVPEDESKGLCPLNCSNAVIGAYEYTIEPIISEFQITCVNANVGDSFNQPITLKYKFVSTESLPVGHIGFEPYLTGAIVDETKTNEENGTITATEVDPAKYTGIVTPKSQWCTDECGVATMEVWPRCVNQATFGVTLMSGAAASVPIQVSIAIDSEETELTGTTGLLGVK